MNWLANNQQTIWAALWAHLALSLPPIVASFLISLPLGWAAHRHQWLRFPVVTGSSLMYAIPSLPLLIVLQGRFPRHGERFLVLLGLDLDQLNL